MEKIYKIESYIKQIVAKFPERGQLSLKRKYYAWQIKNNRFFSPEPEFNLLSQWVSRNDWVIDVGANVGHYTKKFSDIVGPAGRVLAFEPVGATFSLLAANVSCFRYDNVSLFNAAVSDKFTCAKMIIPAFPTGMPNYYEAQLADNTNEGISVLTLSLDGMMIEKKIALIKIDAEGHEIFALSGMRQLIKRWNPVLIVEASSNDAAKYLLELGYTSKKLLGSPNEIFQQN